MSERDLSAAEAERQLRAAMARHHEAVASLDQRGRSESAALTAAGAEERGAALVLYALRRAHAAGVDIERLAEISGLAPDVLRKTLEH